MGMPAENEAQVEIPPQLFSSFGDDEELKSNLQKINEALNMVVWALNTKDELKILLEEIGEYNSKARTAKDKEQRKRYNCLAANLRKCVGNILSSICWRLGATVAITGTSLLITYGSLSACISCTVGAAAVPLVVLSVVSGIAAVLGVVGCFALAALAGYGLYKLLSN